MLIEYIAEMVSKVNFCLTCTFNSTNSHEKISVQKEKQNAQTNSKTVKEQPL
jgi:hypothetical protein